jgi:hypothetical protein
MKKRTVITNTPTKLPIGSTILYTFLLWHFEVNPIIKGVFITLYSLYWIAALVTKYNEISVDLDKDEWPTNKKKSKWQERLSQLSKQK